MVDHILLATRSLDEPCETIELELTAKTMMLISSFAKKHDIDTEIAINTLLRQAIMEKEFGTTNAIFAGDSKLLTDEEFENLFDDLPFYIVGDEPGKNVAVISPEEYDKLKGIS